MNFKQNISRYVAGLVIVLALVLVGTQYTNIEKGLGYVGDKANAPVAAVARSIERPPIIVNDGSGTNVVAWTSGNGSSNSGESGSGSGEAGYSLMVSILDKNRGTSGSITSVPKGGINCGNDCYESYTKGKEITLISVSNKTSHQIGWQITTRSDNGKQMSTKMTDCSINTNTCKVSFVMNSDIDAVAIFMKNKNLKKYTLTTKTETENGSIVGDVVVDPCMDDTWTKVGRIRTYDEGDKVSLTVTHPSNITFAGWSGACTGMGTCDLIMDSNKVVTAKFKGLSILDRRRWGITPSSEGVGLGFGCKW